MSTRTYELEVGGYSVEVVQKDIKNLHVSVNPPLGHVRVSAPLILDREAVRLAIVSRLRWIRDKKARFEAQERQSMREFVTGESHYFQGRRYRLEVKEGVHSSAQLGPPGKLLIEVPLGSDVRKREGVLNEWYRDELKRLLADLQSKWEERIGIDVEVRIKRMKTKWGSCNDQARRIWLNLELAKRHVSCVEYVLVHEMVHLIERTHNAKFVDMMDALFPNWRLLRDELNRGPLSDENWRTNEASKRQIPRSDAPTGYRKRRDGPTMNGTKSRTRVIGTRHGDE